MLGRALTRFAVGLAVIAGVVTLTFALLHAAPGDPAERLLGPSATPTQLQDTRRALGLDRPLPVQYATWVANFARGNWGTSIGTGQSVRSMIARAWPETVLLVGVSLALSYLLGLIIGAVQAARAGSALDTGLSVTTVTLYALPGYWLGLMLIMLCTYELKILPGFGATGYDADLLTGWARVVDRLRHLALPLLTLTLIGMGGTARFVRGAMLDVLGDPFVTTARAKGLTPSRIMRRHVFRNATVPVVTLLGLSLPALFSGAVFVEAVFAWPGVGRILVEAVQARDYPVVLTATAISATLVVAGNILADVVVALLDPRMRRRAA